MKLTLSSAFPGFLLAAGAHQMNDEEMANANPLMQLLRTVLPFVNEGVQPDYDMEEDRQEANDQQQHPPDFE